MTLLSRRTALGAGLAVLAAPRLARAAWPERQITLIVPFGAGAGTDMTGRNIAQYLTKDFGQPVVVLNRPGAGGAVGYTALAEAAPDGYTIGITNTPGVVIIPIERSVRFGINTFTPLAGVIEDPAVFAVHPDSGINNAAELIARAKREPGLVTVSIQGVGGSAWVSAKMLEQATGAKFELVSYNAGTAAVLALVKRDVVVGTANLGEGIMMTSGQPWKVLGVMSAQRNPLAPDVPTFREQGIDVVSTTVRGLSAPPNLPAEIAARYAAALDRMAADAEFQALCRRTFQPLNYMPAQRFAEHIRAEDRLFRDMWQRQPWSQ
ncbi:tripartite tricarboxylate transporter substrate binding protein [Roseomonas sp. AR75]|uniref:tripartite tricarboxylate transporter substrate binding protein n=1 Tax=Roseomonas sp. AR75 TaxID=2562311 RepID=UPI0010C128A7|nr:tripartite tricarboxylate transporter substrate binding protein [Roseomonas sp. AR75]